MKTSIRKKMLIYILTAIIFFVLILLFANVFLVEKYYISQKKNDLLENSLLVEKMIEDNTKEMKDENQNDYSFLNADEKFIIEMTKLERESGQLIILTDYEDKVFYPYTSTQSFYAASIIEESQISNNFKITTSPPSVAMTTDAIDSSGLANNNDLQIDYINDNSYFLYSKNKKLDMETISFLNKLDNGVTINLSMSVAAITENVKILNKFIAIISLIAIGFTVIWSFFISGQFTKPITEIQKTTEKMKDLDFSKKIKVNSKDELGMLADDINSLSNSLSTTIDELNLKNKKLAEDIDKERKIDKMRRDFISNVSHELKTPIFLIQGYADGLKENVASEDRREQYCNVIIDEADKMDTLVKDLLGLAKLETEKPDNLQKEKVEINSFIQNIVDKYNFTNTENKIEIQFEKTNDIFVNIDRLKIEQVLTNLINNAIEYRNDKKNIEITISKEEHNDTRISVYNSGENIQEDELERIWDDFYKSDKSRTRTKGRVGLGLSIVKNILNSHKSLFGVNNVEDGVEFWFTLN